ncbi:hypothetical protein PIB30_065435 [Stylosanthes scabra]|uniref:Uncharacterized protein n=1 Tax=Stylosanthes scabra TaxID=79078 RepID=A0ABU6SM37_9FABA|nr:hypothetical protein [Stylosanthes scabra]
MLWFKFLLNRWWPFSPRPALHTDNNPRLNLAKFSEKMVAKSSFVIDKQTMSAEIYAQRSDEIDDVNFRRLVSRSPNASTLIPAASMGLSDREASVVRDIGPLNSVRIASSSRQASGPLYGTNGTGDQSEQNIVERKQCSAEQDKNVFCFP